MGDTHLQSHKISKAAQSGPSDQRVVNFNYVPTATRRPRLLRDPFSTIPLAPDPEFVDRPEILTWVRDKLMWPGSRAALVGLGGVGKSHIALQHAHSIREAAPHTFVFWVHAGSRQRFETAYRDIADRLELPSRHDPKVDVLKLVYDWLCNEENGKWLMILDNVDDAVSFGPLQHGGTPTPANQPQSLTIYLPRSRNGSILVTSRNKTVAASLTGHYENIKDICEMNVEEGLQLLCNKLQDKPALDNALELLLALDYMPLAISQATAYINHRTRVTTADYLDELRASSKNKEYLLNSESSDFCGDENASSSVAKTWQMSFDRLRQERPSAADLLSLMSFFHAQDIPEEALRQHSNKHHVNCDGSDSSESFDKDLDLLRVYSFITAVPNTSAYSMHALVQFFTRSWLTLAGDARRYELEFVSLMAQAYPTASFETRSECQQLLPHAERLLEVNPENIVLVKIWAQALTNVAFFMLMQGSYKGGQELVSKVLLAQETLLGPNHESVLESLDLLGLLMRTDGNYMEARTHIERARAGRMRLYGKSHEMTLISTSNLAGLFRDLSMLEDAGRLYKEVYEHRKDAMGSSHVTTLASASNLAIVLQDLGKYKDAATYCHYALSGSQEKLGQHHPDTLLSLNNLGGVLQAMGHLQEAENSYRRALKGREMVFGSKHPSTLTSKSNVASVLLEQGRYLEAETISRQVLEQRTGIDEKHPHTFTSIANLSRVLEEQEKFQEAEALSRQALQGRMEILGEHHLDTLVSTNNLAILLGKMKRYEEAAKLYKKASDGFETKLGPQHPWSVACRSNLSDVELKAQALSTKLDNLFARAKTRLKRGTSDRLISAQSITTLQTRSFNNLESRASSIATSSRRYGTSAV